MIALWSMGTSIFFNSWSQLIKVILKRFYKIPRGHMHVLAFTINGTHIRYFSKLFSVLFSEYIGQILFKHPRVPKKC